METFGITLVVVIITISAIITFKILQAWIDADIVREQEESGKCLSCGHRIHNLGPKS